jgi:hypothetical protein
MGETHHVPTIDELIELPRPGDAQLSPAGDRVAYTVVKPDWEANEYVSQLWLVDNTAAETPPTPRQLTFAKTSSYAPRW